MKFKDEYKKELNKISPTEEQCERIRSGVAKKIAESAPVKKKKPIYLRIAAVSGASICAAAVLIVVIFGMGGGKHFYSLNMAPSANEGINAAGSNVCAGGADQELPPKNEDNTQHSYGSTSMSTANAQSDPSSAGTSQDTSMSIGGTSPEPSKSPDSDGKTDSGGADGGEPMTGGGDELIPCEPAPPTGGGEIPDGFVYLAFSEDNGICEVTVNEATRSYRLDKDASAPPLSYDTAFKAIANNGLDVLAQFDGDMMFIYFKDGRIYNIYSII